MASEIGARREELAALRHELDDLRLHLPDAFVEGDLASERVSFMSRVGCQVFRCTPEQAKTLHARDLFVAGRPGAAGLRALPGAPPPQRGHPGPARGDEFARRERRRELTEEPR